MMKHVLTGLGILTGLVLFAFSPPMREMPWTPLRIAGLALGIPAFVLWFVARLQLGDSFSIRPEARVLVTQGIYSRIRNPIYVFGGLLVCGMILFFNYPAGLLIFAALVPLQVSRIKKEEKVLEEKFGDAYREYKKNTWF